jgi:hypothetical protein
VRFRVKVLETLGGTASAAGAGHRDQRQGELAGNVVYGGNSIARLLERERRARVARNGQADACSLAFDLSDDGIAVGRIVGGLDSEPFQWTASTGKQPIALAPAPSRSPSTASRRSATRSRASRRCRRDLAPGRRELHHGRTGDVLVRDINTLGCVTGIAGRRRAACAAFRWSAGAGFTELALPAGFVHAHGNGLNDANVVVGLSRTPDRDQATRWNPGSAPLLLPYARAEDTHSAALDLNADGWIVGVESGDPLAPGGSRGVVWIDGQALALKRLPQPAAARDGGPRHRRLRRQRVGTDRRARLVNGVERALRLDP